MRARWGLGREVICEADERGDRSVEGMVDGAKGVVVVGAWSMRVVISVFAASGVTFSMRVKAGRRRIVVG